MLMEWLGFKQWMAENQKPGGWGTEFLQFVNWEEPIAFSVLDQAPSKVLGIAEVAEKAWHPPVLPALLLSLTMAAFCVTDTFSQTVP